MVMPTLTVEVTIEIRKGFFNTSVGEECSAKVKDEVDAGELLPGLDKNAGECTEEDPIFRGTEAVHVRTIAK